MKEYGAGAPRMEIRPIDPRDSRWEVDDPTYRVIFWSELKQSDGTSAWASSEFDVSGTGIQVEEVISWARAHPENSTHIVIYVRVDIAGESGLIKIAGAQPEL